MDFRFSHEKMPEGFLRRTPNFTYQEFRDNVMALYGAVQSIQPVNAEIISIEDLDVYRWSTVTTISDDKTEAMKKRITTPLSDLDENLWNRAFGIELNMQAKDLFMICLAQDRHAEPEKLFFYGQDVDGKTYKRVMEMFHKEGSSYVLGNGRHKISEFNAALAMSHLFGKKPRNRNFGAFSA